MFYDHAPHAVDQLADYVAEGLCAGEAVITVLMPEHADALTPALQGRGIDVQRDQDEGRLFLLDAAETLSTFLVDGVPDPELFAQGVGTLLSGLNESGRRVRAAGEMVAILWAEGNVTGVFAGRPLMLLTTTGAKSGQPRTAPLVYTTDGSSQSEVRRIELTRSGGDYLISGDEIVG